MSVAIKTANGGSEYLQFPNSSGNMSAMIGGYDDGTNTGHLEFYTNGGSGVAERVRIDSAGNVGIGTTAISSGYISGNGALTFQNAKSIAFNNSSNTWSTTTTGGAITYFTDNNLYIDAKDSTSNMIFRVNGATERMRIDSSGNLLVGTTSTPISGSHAFYNSGGNGVLSARCTAATAGKYHNFGPDSNGNFRVFNQSAVGVYLGDGNTSWTAFSDERFKTGLIPIENAATKVASLRAVTGRYITDEEGKSRAFLIAQDVQAVLPEAVDATDPEKLGVQYTDVIPLLVAAIKEQQVLISDQAVIIADLKTRIETLEAK